MFIMPLPFLLGTLAGLASLGLLMGGIYILWAWYVGTLIATSWLVSGIVMLLWSAFGRSLVLMFYRRGNDEPRMVHSSDAREIQAPDGSTLHVEYEGSAQNPTIVLTHGWALDSTAWYYVRKQLSKQYHLVLWDLPGLGQSTQPADHRYSVERLAEDLRRVIEAAGNKPVTLVGHSIGGMMILTLWRLHPEFFEEKVNGIVFIDTTYTWPLNTVMGGGLLKLLRWPLIEPLLWLTIVLSPIVRLMSLQSYMNGNSHIVNRITSLSHDVTRGQLDFAAKYNVKDKPSVLAKGLRAVLRWDETKTPASITVPTRVIAGNADKLTKPEAGMRMSQMIPGADFIKIIPAGHNGLLEEGRQYSDAIAGLVQRASAAASRESTSPSPR
jgi:pimeloyl-ACP methyl ester carboxylesterase